MGEWEYVPPKNDDGIIGQSDGKKGTQKSPFGMWSN